MPKRDLGLVEGDRVRLRLLESTDLPMTLAWRNQDHIRRWFLNSAPIDPEEHRRWFEQYQARDDDFVFIIEDADQLRRPVGQVALYNIDWFAESAEFGRLMIGDGEAAGRGLARTATALLVNAAARWGLRRVRLSVLRDNVRAISIYHDCGFRTTAEDGRIMEMLNDRPGVRQ